MIDRTTPEEQQEVNLRRGWRIRKDTATQIGSYDGYDLYAWKDNFGRHLFYAVRGETPVCYVAGQIDLDNKTTFISSTFITPIARRRGIGTAIYKSIIPHVGRLVSDFERSAGAEALWKKLMRDPTLLIIEDDRRYVATVR